MGFGWLTDRLGRKKLFFITLAVYLAATAATGLSWNLWSFCLFRFLTGAGIGAKGQHRRNFEAGIITEDKAMIRGLMDFLDAFYLGDHCLKCQRRDLCPDPIA